MTKYDVIIAGAGPAGSTAGKLLADRGYKVLMVDREAFPRDKVCAGWINRETFERFSYLEPIKEDLIDSPFYGLTFHSLDFSRRVDYNEREPVGYLSTRLNFDTGLKDLAVEAGVEFMGGIGVRSVSVLEDRASVELENGEKYSGEVIIGADGANSIVARQIGLYKGWDRKSCAICANEDIEYSQEKIDGFFGPRRSIEICPNYSGIRGYGWLFPKREHICIGIGAFLREGEDIGELFIRFMGDLRKNGLIPDDLVSKKYHIALDPAGKVHDLDKIHSDRVLLVGDAVGFASGVSGEGIYPGMMSAKSAADVIDKALKNRDIEGTLPEYEKIWRENIGDYLKGFGGRKERLVASEISLIYRSRLVANLAARMYLYGERPGFRIPPMLVWK